MRAFRRNAPTTVGLNHELIDLPPDGQFDLPNVPGEVLNLEVGMSGYRTASKPPELGRLQSDRTGLVFVMEPGK